MTEDTEIEFPKTITLLLIIEYITIAIVTIALIIPALHKHFAFGNVTQFIWSLYFIQGVKKRSAQAITWAWWMLVIQTIGVSIAGVVVAFGNSGIYLFDTWRLDRAWGFGFVACGLVAVVIKFILLNSRETKTFVTEIFR